MSTPKTITSYPKEKTKIVLLENINAKAIDYFNRNGYSNVQVFKESWNETQLMEQLKDAHLLGIRSKTQLTKKVLDRLPKLQAVGCFCIGTNQVDLSAATKNGICVFNAPYSNTRSVAELVLASAILLIRKVLPKNKLAHDGIWMKDHTNAYELRGKTIGIVGYGNIGSQVSVLAESLGAKVIYYDIANKLSLGNAQPMPSLDELLCNSDIITLHLPNTAQTNQLFTLKKFKKCKEGSVFINYARGEIVDILALKECLTTNHLSGAAIDVFPVEPNKNGAGFTSPLQGLDNVLLTPHVGGSTEEAQVRIGEEVSVKMVDFLEKGSSVFSLSLPAIQLETVRDSCRILHIHQNIPGILSTINGLIARYKINILAQYLKTNEQVGYVVLDVEKKDNIPSLIKEMKVSEGTIKARLLY